MTQWYYVDPQQQRQGPVTAAALAQQFHLRALDMASLVWREGMGQWQPLREVAAELNLPVAAPVPPPLAAPVDIAAEEPERPLTGRAVFTAREPTYAQHAAPHASQAEAVAAAAHAQTAYGAGRVQEEASPYAAPLTSMHASMHAVTEGHVVHAGFWKRTAAYLIDYFITSLIGGMIGAIIGAVMGGLLSGDSAPGSMGFLLIQLVSGLAGMVISFTYFAWFQSSGLQATPGKLAIGIKLVRGNGEPVTFLRAIARCFAMILSGLILFVGYAMAGFTQRKQGLHDLICDTLVVDKWAYTRYPERQREELGTVAWVTLILAGLFIVGVMVLVFAGIGMASMGR